MSEWLSMIATTDLGSGLGGRKDSRSRGQTGVVVKRKNPFHPFGMATRS